MRLLDIATRAVFGVLSGALMLLAGALLIYAATRVIGVFQLPEAAVGSTLLAAIGYTVVSLASSRSPNISSRKRSSTRARCATPARRGAA